MPSKVLRAPRSWARPLLGLSVAVASVLIAAPLFVVMQRGGSSAVVRVRVADIAQGFTPMSIDGLAGVVSRDGDDIVVLAGREPHLDDQLALCPNSQTLVGTNGSSQYDRHGIKHGGPVPRSLDRFASERDGGELVVHSDRIEYRDVTGRPMAPPSGAEPVLPPLVYSEPWARNFLTGGSPCSDLRLRVSAGT